MSKAAKLVLIEWLDSCGRSDGDAWTRAQPHKRALSVKSVGWLVHNGKSAKTVAAHITCDIHPQRCGEMTIPTGAIVKMTRLK